LEEWGRNFEDCFKWGVGNGKEVKFWEDIWVGKEDPKRKFLRLFSLSNYKDANIDSFGVWTNGS